MKTVSFLKFHTTTALAVFVAAFLFVLSANAQETSPRIIEGEPQIQFCSEYFSFGEVVIEATSPSDSVLPGNTIDFNISIENKNPEPIIQGRVYMKIFKTSEIDFETASRNGYPAVDFVQVADGLLIPANETIDINTSWTAPQGIDGGSYSANFYLNEDGTSEFSGLFTTEHNYGGSIPFGVVSKDKGTDLYFDKGSVSLNGNTINLSGPVYKFGENELINISVDVVNPSNEINSGMLRWWVSNWDGAFISEETVYEEKLVELAPNESEKVSLLVPASAGPDILLQGIIEQDGAKSVLHVRAVRGDSDTGDIVYSGLTPLVVGANNNATLYTCVRDLMKGTAGDLELTTIILDSSGNKLHEVTENLNNKNLPALVKSSATFSNDGGEILLNTKLSENGKVISEVWKSYDCNNRLGDICGTYVATEREENTTMLVVVTLLSLTVLLAILVYKRKSKETLEKTHYPEN